MKLEVSTETIPRRAEWMRSPRFDTQALLVQSHDAFVRCADSIRQRFELLSAPEMPDRRRARLLGKLADFYREWQWGMSCHERYEEGKLYPFLTRRFGLALDRLESDHRALHVLADDAETSLRAVADDVAAAGLWTAGHSALHSYRRALIDHLQREEELVIPALLQLTPCEFSAYAGGESCQAAPAS